MKLIDGHSLERWVKTRLKWHKDLTVEEVIEMIHDAPEINEKGKINAKVLFRWIFNR